MTQVVSPMELLRVLDKSNCGKCDEPTCLAFAAAVFKGRRRLDECPHLGRDALERFGGTVEKGKTVEQDMANAVELLKGKVREMDLSSAASRLGGRFSDGTLTLRILGKDFHIDAEANLSSEIHIHPWVTIPILTYLLQSTGGPVSGTWVPFRELEGGKTWYRLFEQRCEKPLKRVADAYTDLFEDMLHVFNGRRVENLHDSDISLVLYPLPKVPVLICYWRPEDGLESSLHLFFDSAAEDHLPIEAIYALGTGLVRMFEKIALRHGA